MNYITPKFQSEATIQAELYRACKDVGLNVVVEYSVLHDDYSDRRGCECRLDVVLVVGCDIFAIVEIKRSDVPVDENQLGRYRAYGPEVYVCTSQWDVPYLVEELLRKRQQYLSVQNREGEELLVRSQIEHERTEGSPVFVLEWFRKVYPDLKWPLPFSMQKVVDWMNVLGANDVIAHVLQSRDRYPTQEEGFEWLIRYLDYRANGKINP